MPSQLHIQIDHRTGVPVYRQVMDQLRYYVSGGTLRPGDQIPSIRELATVLAVNPTTVVKAYTELEREGIIAMRHGKGAFIAERAATLSTRDQDDALRRGARQLAVEASQMGVAAGRVLAIVREELNIIQPERVDEPAPIKFTVVAGG
ncbi:MAG TPA: GntR family transcriptional regulator [Candidatus Limnocylindria bacterium]|jgi:GntR family transcriptional regulator|nr:GntR family transcriptional regulator [Candidatus Limnocylindria bacterium]